MIINSKRYFTWAVAISATAFCFFSCKPDQPDTLNYDRAALLNNIGNNYIVPAYQDLNTATDNLQNTIAYFQSNTDQIGLDSLRMAYEAAYLSWVKCATFEFGPAADQSLRASLNTFPTDSVQIKSNISAGTWDLAIAANIDAKGFPAMDYLLFGTSTQDSVIVNSFSSWPDAVNRMNYLSAISSEVKNKVSAVLWTWQNAYINDFKAADGTDAGSSTSFIVNQLNYELEILKNIRIGIPLGVQTLGVKNPGHVEAFYDGFSLDLAKANLQSMEDIYHGKSYTGSNGYGLHDALIDVNAQYNGAYLADAISPQFNTAQTALAAIPDPLSDAVNNNTALVQTAYNEIKKLVILMKTDMASALGILITYVDNDGD